MLETLDLFAGACNAALKAAQETCKHRAYAIHHECYKAIVLEDLTGIRKRGNNKGKRMRRMLGQWAFYQLRAFMEYKAKEAGVQVIFIIPAYTSKYSPPEIR